MLNNQSNQFSFLSNISQTNVDESRSKSLNAPEGKLEFAGLLSSIVSIQDGFKAMQKRLDEEASEKLKLNETITLNKKQIEALNKQKNDLIEKDKSSLEKIEFQSNRIASLELKVKFHEEENALLKKKLNNLMQEAESGYFNDTQSIIDRSNDETKIDDSQFGSKKQSIQSGNPKNIPEGIAVQNILNLTIESNSNLSNFTEEIIILNTKIQALEKENTIFAETSKKLQETIKNKTTILNAFITGCCERSCAASEFLSTLVNDDAEFVKSLKNINIDNAQSLAERTTFENLRLKKELNALKSEVIKLNDQNLQLSKFKEEMMGKLKPKLGVFEELLKDRAEWNRIASNYHTSSTYYHVDARYFVRHLLDEMYIQIENLQKLLIGFVNPKA